MTRFGTEDQYYTTLGRVPPVRELAHPARRIHLEVYDAHANTHPPADQGPEDSRLGLNPDGKAVWTFVVNGETIYCNIGELQAACANRLGLSGVY